MNEDNLGMMGAEQLDELDDFEVVHNTENQFFVDTGDKVFNLDIHRYGSHSSIVRKVMAESLKRLTAEERELIDNYLGTLEEEPQNKIGMTKLQDQVKEFMIQAGQDCPDGPTISSQEVRILRVRLLLEEVLELAEASGVTIFDAGQVVSMGDLSFEAVEEANLLEIADALTDINYVSYGAGVAFGLDLEPFEQAVHANNMTKFEDGFRDENGKWRKGPSYKPVDLQPVLDAQIV